MATSSYILSNSSFTTQAFISTDIWQQPANNGIYTVNSDSVGQMGPPGLTYVLTQSTNDEW
jgi:hypothetical protein